MIKNDKKLKTSDILYIMLFVILVVNMLHLSFRQGFDTDSYFIVNTGKYIVENKEIPTKNIWTMHEDFDVIIQQWLCCIENYTAFSLTASIGLDGELGQSFLTIIHIILYIFIALNYLKLYTDKPEAKLITLYVISQIAYGHITARPSLVTMSIITYEVTQLEKHKRGLINFKNLMIKLLAISLIQINYHSALWVFTIIFLLPYTTPISTKLKDWIKATKTFLTYSIPMFIVALLNPNKLDGILYLFKSLEILSGLNIYELASPVMKQQEAFYIIIIIILLTLYIKEKRLTENKEIIYIALGTIFMSTQQIRNIWTLAIPIVPLATHFLNKYRLQTKREKTVNKKVLIIVLLLLTPYALYSVICGIKYAYYKKDSINAPIKALEYLNNLKETNKKEWEEIILYNEFNNGAYLEFNGYKTYIDARPELYMKIINHKEDILLESENERLGKHDKTQFIDKYNFNTFITENNSGMQLYLKYNNKYKKVIDAEEYEVYRLKEDGRG